METRFELKTTCFDIMINYNLLQKLKLTGNDETLNHYSNNPEPAPKIHSFPFCHCVLIIRSCIQFGIRASQKQAYTHSQDLLR